MTIAIEKPALFDSSAAVNAIRDRIRGAMLDIIPDEQWDALIKAEMHAFMNDTVEQRAYGESATRLAGFKRIVRELLEEDAKKRLTALLTSSEWTGQWMGGDQQTSEAVKKYITANAGEILNAWVGVAVQRVIQQMQYTR